MADRPVLQIGQTVVTLEKLHDGMRKADGSETISLRTLEQHAKSGKLPGAWRLGGIWMVNLLALAQQGYSRPGDGGEAQEEEGAPKEEKGERKRRGRGRAVPGEEAPAGRERLRYAP